MASKQTKSKNSTKSEKSDPRARQMLWYRIAFIIFALILVVSMLLSLVVKY